MVKIIVSDTSCLIALSNIDMLNVLKDLYQEVIITEEVQAEYGDYLPDWIMVSKVLNKEVQSRIQDKLDIGEASSIALALEIENSVLIIDEVKGRKIAKSYDLEIIGTIGVLILAYRIGRIDDLERVVLQLVENGFRLSQKIIDRLIKEFGNK